MSRVRVLFIDAYDSFTNNIVSLVENQLGVEVTKIHIDSYVGDLATFIQPFDAVIAGPGPGNPEVLDDVGIIASLWRIDETHIKPVLGVCLGFQSLVCAFGGRMERLSRPRHGISTQVDTCGKDLFNGLTDFQTVQYHSLRANLGQPEPSCIASEPCSELTPLAWDLSDPSGGPILMSVKHRLKPFWGIQFHPESILSSSEAKNVIRNWWLLCKKWNQSREDLRGVEKTQSCSLNNDASGDTYTVDSLSPSSMPATPSSENSMSSNTSYTTTRESSIAENYVHTAIPLDRLTVSDIVHRLELQNDEFVVLDSEQRLMANLGRYSIIGQVDRITTKLTYQAGNGVIKITTAEYTALEQVGSLKSALSYLKNYLNQHKVENGYRDIPFWGGLMGYITYEGCLETIGIPTQTHANRDDMCFAFVERSIVIDHLHGVVILQSIKSGDEIWLQSTSSKLLGTSPTTSIKPATPEALISRLPEKSSYMSKIDRCQEEIQAGNSYELCLTNQAAFKSRKSPSCTSWQKYQTLRALNPAPFASYLHMNSATILSTSPERFLNWARPTLDEHGRSLSVCQFRPIKGTVQKTQILPDGTPHGVALQEAMQILSTPKETAENLMIVDLIRHDLHGVVGSGNVTVPTLMQVEEYATVYQLVSVIEGSIYSTPALSSRTSGIDVLASSLPPGSMTGTPKRRACEILNTLEDEPRSIYSGVIGYMCVGGGGDFSVTIRTVFKWDDEDEGGNETWRIGAGGAITILSDVQGEWEEMCGKLGSTRRLFKE
ncbi:MAG: hypothetical protein GOMPHAMPRED_006466 [Gomphillus americanus]|uniref:aminodeoxychorismate synthase n=1 Tax=Gomphillus americanus TaxID=1940652 RepID=A0A8H3FZT1_9LECA|nr:MAG: hypothetical protein GOMPHAMPRED_006466 [Gomphillus americanus]